MRASSIWPAFRWRRMAATNSNPAYSWPGDDPALTSLEAYCTKLVQNDYLKAGDIQKILNAPGANCNVTTRRRPAGLGDSRREERPESLQGQGSRRLQHHFLPSRRTMSTIPPLDRDQALRMATKDLSSFAKAATPAFTGKTKRPRADGITTSTSSQPPSGDCRETPTDDAASAISRVLNSR